MVNVIVVRPGGMAAMGRSGIGVDDRGGFFGNLGGVVVLVPRFLSCLGLLSLLGLGDGRVARCVLEVGGVVGPLTEEVVFFRFLCFLWGSFSVAGLGGRAGDGGALSGGIGSRATGQPPQVGAGAAGEERKEEKYDSH